MVYNGSVILQSSSSSSSCGLDVTTPHESLTTGGRGGDEQWNPLGYNREGCSLLCSTMMLFGMLFDEGRQLFPVVVVGTVGICGNTIEVNTVVVVVVVGVVSTITSTSWHEGLECGDDDTSSSSWITPSPTTHNKEG